MSADSDPLAVPQRPRLQLLRPLRQRRRGHHAAADDNCLRNNDIAGRDNSCPRSNGRSSWDDEHRACPLTIRRRDDEHRACPRTISRRDDDRHSFSHDGGAYNNNTDNNKSAFDHYRRYGSERMGVET